MCLWVWVAYGEMEKNFCVPNTPELVASVCAQNTPRRTAPIPRKMSVEVAPVAAAPLAEAVLAEDADDESDYEDERSTDEDDDAGSLVDFIVNDEGEEGEDAESEAGSEAASEPATKEEALKRDLDGIDPANIVAGRRVRRRTQFLEREIFASADYRRMMLCDVPKEELHAAAASSASSECEVEDSESEGEDGSYAPTDEEEEEESDCESAK